MSFFSKLLAPLLPLATMLPIDAVEYGLFIRGKTEGWISGSDGGIAGAAGAREIAAAFRISGLPVALEWRAYSTRTGWMDWTPADGTAASTGGKSLEAIQFRFPKGLASHQRLYGRVHITSACWLRTILIDESVVLGATARGWSLDAIQLSYAEGEAGANPDLVEKADAAFNLHLPAGHMPSADPDRHPVRIFPDEPGLARWTWMAGRKEDDFWLIVNGAAHQDGIVGRWERLDTPEYPAYPPSYRVTYGQGEVNTMTLNWNGTVMTGRNQNGLPVSAARTDGDQQLRPGQRPAFAMEKKLETMVIPALFLDDVPLEEAVKTLREKSIELDTGEKDQATRGIPFSIHHPEGREIGNVRWRTAHISMRCAVDQLARKTGTFAVVDKSGVLFVRNEDR